MDEHGSRGPDPQELKISNAFNELRDDYLAMYRLRAQLLKRADRMLRTKDNLRVLTEGTFHLPFGREVDNVLAMRGNGAFWDRTPVN